MHEKEFQKRLSQLRSEQGISARDMSLSLGQNPGYINTIENGKAFPTMSNFFYICDFLKISPREFFDIETERPQKIKTLTEELKLLNPQQLDAIVFLVEELISKR